MSETAGFYYLDFVAHGRLTHSPSGDTLIRHSWMGDEQWGSALREYAAAHPGDHEVRSYRGHRVGDLRDFPEFGGSLAIGDCLLSTDGQGMQSSRLVTGILPDTEGGYVLEDGSIAFWENMGWSAPSVSNSNNRDWLSKIREGEPRPGLDLGAALLGVVGQTRDLLDRDEHLHRMALRLSDEDRNSLGGTYKKLLVEVDEMERHLRDRVGLVNIQDDDLERGASLLHRLVEHIEACRDHPEASPQLGVSSWSGTGQFLMRASAVERLLVDAGHAPAAAPTP